MKAPLSRVTDFSDFYPQFSRVKNLYTNYIFPSSNVQDKSVLFGHNKGVTNEEDLEMDLRDPDRFNSYRRPGRISVRGTQSHDYRQRPPGIWLPAATTREPATSE